MARFVFAILIAASAASAQAQSAASATPIKPSVDTVEQREELRDLVGCVAKSNPEWARELLAYPYLSDAQARSAAEIFSGRDNCLRRPEMEMMFRTSSIVSNLAEYFLRTSSASSDLGRLSASLNTQNPLNTSEDFALCVASRAPAAARDLSLSRPGSGEELRAAGQLGRQIQPCVRPGENLTVDLQALRGLMSIALYRASGLSRN